MLNLSEEFKFKIINRYNKEGNNWLKNVDNIIAKYKRKFQLEDLILVDQLSMNIVLFAKCKNYGEIVMKIGSPGETAISEINIMKQYPQNYTPKCYYSSLADRVMIQERLTPGYSLSNLEKREKRVEIFCNLVNQLTVINNNKNFRTYDEMFKKNIEYVYKNKKNYSNIIWMIDKANEIYQNITEMNLPKYVLHNDLHHKNILKSDTTWKAIDAHGIIGEKVFETSQFIRAELENFDIGMNKIDELALLIEKHLKEDKNLILQALYITIVLKIIVYIKSKYDISIILYNINISKEILKYIEI